MTYIVSGGALNSTHSLTLNLISTEQKFALFCFLRVHTQPKTLLSLQNSIVVLSGKFTRGLNSVFSTKKNQQPIVYDSNSTIACSTVYARLCSSWFNVTQVHHSQTG